MSAPNLNDIFVRDENRIGGEIHRRTINSSVWLKLVPKEAWPDGMSDVIQVLTVERNLPDNIDTWSSIASPNDNSNNCVPTPDEIPSGQTLRSFNLSQKAVKSERICVNDTRNAYRTAEQVKAMYANLTAVVKYIWQRRAKVEYSRLAEHKMIAAAGLPEGEAAFPIITPTSILTQGILDKIYVDLIAESAELDGGSLAMIDGAPQFILVTDMETSKRIRTEDNTLNSFLYNNKRVPELLQSMNVSNAWMGYFHMLDNLPRRWNLTGGVWVEVAPYEEVATSRGTKLKISDAWRSAPFMDSYVFLPSVFSFVVPKPITTVGSGTEFTAQQYMGDFTWLNWGNDDTNPTRSHGYYHALLQSGSKPVHPEFGYVIRHLRCPGDFGAQECPETDPVNALDLSGSDSYFAG